MTETTPRARALDSSLRLLRDPYGYIAQLARGAGSDVVEARILGQRTLCLVGQEAAELFYDPQLFRRAGAAPLPVQLTLFGRKGVQTLDDAEHRRRKALFLSITMDSDGVRELADAVTRGWLDRARAWQDADEVELYPELVRLLTRHACAWAGVPLPEDEVDRRAAQLSALFDEAAAPGLGHARSLLARRAANRWATGLVEDVRSGATMADESTALHAVAHHRGGDGELLPAATAAVELLNVLRPTVAVAVYLVLVAQALEEHPEWRTRLRRSADHDDAFVQEVRRHYPFFPTAVARTRRDFVWRGHRFPRGRRVLLDLYATNHDERAWDEPHVFRPERFLGAAPGPYAFVPQGGGDPYVHHRCPGERITAALMHVGVEVLARRLEHEVVTSPLDRSRAPALPSDGLRLRAVRLRR